MELIEESLDVLEEAKREFQFNKNTLDLFFLTDKIANKFLINLIKKRILIISNLLLHPIYKIIIFLNNKLKIKFFNKFILILKYHDDNLILHKSKKNLILSYQHINEGNFFLNNNKLSKITFRHGKHSFELFITKRHLFK